MSCEELVRVNVGGQVFETSRQTLRPSTFFSALLDGPWREAHGAPIFVDRDPVLFRHVLNVLREPRYPLPCDLPELKLELDYFGVTLDPNRPVGASPPTCPSEASRDGEPFVTCTPVATSKYFFWPDHLGRLPDDAKTSCDRYYARLKERHAGPLLPVPHLTTLETCAGSYENGRSIFQILSCDGVVRRTWLEFRVYDVLAQRYLTRKQVLKRRSLSTLIRRIESSRNGNVYDGIDGGMLERQADLNDGWDASTLLAKQPNSLLAVARSENAHALSFLLPVFQAIDPATLGIETAGTVEGLYFCRTCSICVFWNLAPEYRLRNVVLKYESEHRPNPEEPLFDRDYEFPMAQWGSWKEERELRRWTLARSPTMDLRDPFLVDMPLNHVLQQLVICVRVDGVATRLKRLELFAWATNPPRRQTIFAYDELGLLEHMARNCYAPKTPVYCISCANSFVNLSRIDSIRLEFELRQDPWANAPTGTPDTVVGVDYDVLMLNFCQVRCGSSCIRYAS